MTVVADEFSLPPLAIPRFAWLAFAPGFTEIPAGLEVLPPLNSTVLVTMEPVSRTPSAILQPVHQRSAHTPCSDTLRRHRRIPMAISPPTRRAPLPGSGTATRL